MNTNMIMDEDKFSQRVLKYVPENENKYSSKTLQGNWFERRSKYCFPKLKNETVYKTEYVPKTVRVKRVYVWDMASDAQEGVDPIIHLRSNCDDHPNFFENFTSTTDLSYNHFPKMYKEDVQIKRYYRRFENKFYPMEEYLEPFHNLTNFGLVDYKKESWCREKLFLERPKNSVYKESFLPPHQEYYQFCRLGRPKPLSSFAIETSEAVEALRKRGWNPEQFVLTSSSSQTLKKT